MRKGSIYIYVQQGIESLLCLLKNGHKNYISWPHNKIYWTSYSTWMNNGNMKEINQALAHDENERGGKIWNEKNVKEILYGVIWLVGMQKKLERSWTKNVNWVNENKSCYFM